MKVLVFDTETNGLPIGKNPSIGDTDKWPYILQLSYLVYDTEKMTLLHYYDGIINIADTVSIDKESTAIHGITKLACKRFGEDISLVLNKFNLYLQTVDMVIAHNILFDKRMIMVESIRNHKRHYFTASGIRKPEFCTMKKGVDLCKLSRIGNYGKYYYKYPTLNELHEHIFEQSINNSHNAMVDILACLRCYCQMMHNLDVLKETKSIKWLYDQYEILS